MTHSTRIGAIAVSALLAATTPAAVIAQDEQAPATQDEQAPAAQEVTSAELDAFAAAYESVIAIDADYAQRMEQATDDAARQGLLEESQVAKVEAVETIEGIDVTRYVEILTLAQADPALTAQIVERLEQ
jgi:hypothetical protein